MKNSLVREKVVLFRVIGRRGKVHFKSLSESEAIRYRDLWNSRKVATTHGTVRVQRLHCTIKSVENVR